MSAPNDEVMVKYMNLVLVGASAYMPSNARSPCYACVVTSSATFMYVDRIIGL